MRAGLVAGLALAAGGCMTPRHYMGISTRTPIAPEDQARADAAVAAAPAGEPGCPWSVDGARPVNVPCEALPLPRLAMLAGMDHKPALLELGIRFEEGRGVPQDWAKAERAYRLAAWQNSFIAGQQVAGVAAPPGARFEPIMVPGAPGLESAEARLASLRARRKAP